MKEVIHHGLEPQLARKVSEKAIESYSLRFKQYQPNFSWTSDLTGVLTFKVGRKTYKADISIVGPNLVIEMTIPLLARMFVGQAVNTIRAEVGKWVQLAKEGKI